MKNKLLSIIPVLLLPFFLLNCATVKSSRDSYVLEIESPVLIELKADSVVLTIDHVSEKDSAGQIYNMAETILNKQYAQYRNFDETAALSIEIIQRSFMKGVEAFNSVYIAANVYRADGTLLIKENEYLSGSMTMLSAVDQHAYISRVLGRILDVQKKLYEKRETEEIQRKKDIKETE